MPPNLLHLLMFWYANQKFQIGWGGVRSQKFSTTNGIRQGGLISPLLFNVYMDNLSCKLNVLGVGCYVSNTCINHICYADDLVILAPSVRALQCLLDQCSKYAEEHDVTFSVGVDGKSQCMICWLRKYRSKFLPSFSLSGVVLPIVDRYEYLGYTVRDNQQDDDEMVKRV